MSQSTRSEEHGLGMWADDTRRLADSATERSSFASSYRCD